MNAKNPLASKIASPYARALFDFSVEKNIMHQITADFQNLEIFLKQNLTKDSLFKLVRLTMSKENFQLVL